MVKFMAIAPRACPGQDLLETGPCAEMTLDEWKEPAVTCLICSPISIPRASESGPTPKSRHPDLGGLGKEAYYCGSWSRLVATDRVGAQLALTMVGP